MKKILLLLILLSNLYAGKYIRVYYVLYGNSTLGDCIFIELPNGKNVLIDGGRLESTSSWLYEFLNDRNVTTINHMVLTHPDEDHSAGLKMVMDNYIVDNFYCTGQDEVNEMNEDKPNRISNEGCEVWRISDFSGEPYNCYLSGPDTNFGPNWDNDVVVRVLCADDSKTGNGRSLVLKISLGDSSFYFGGDAEGDQEDYISSNVFEEAPIDIFKLEHHGSNTNRSNNQDFIDWMQPKFAIIPTGGHTVVNGPPADETIERLISKKCIIYRTDLDGTILIKADDKGNYDIVRMNAFEKLENIDGDDYEEVTPLPTAFPGHSISDFDMGSQVSRTYILPPPDIPQNLVIKKIEGDNVTIDWDYAPSPSIAGYYLFYSTQSGGDKGANNGWKNPGMDEETGIYSRYDTLITTHPFTFSTSDLGVSQPIYLRLSAITTYYYERRYSNEVYTTWPPTTITTLTGFYVTGTSGDVVLSWIAPAKYDNGTSTEPTGRYYVYFSTNSAQEITTWNTVDDPQIFEIDFSTIQPKNPGEKETFFIKRIPAPGNNATVYFAVLSKNQDGVFSSISNITTFTVVDVSSPSAITDLAYANWRDEDEIYISWTMPGDDLDGGNASFCQIAFSTTNTHLNSSTRTLTSPASYGKKQLYLLTGLSAYKRYWIKVFTFDEAFNFSTSNVLSCYTGANFVYTPSFSNALNISTAPVLSVSFKVQISTLTKKSDIQISALRDNQGNLLSTSVDAGDFYLYTSSFRFSPALNNNYLYQLKITTALKDIDGIQIGNNETFDFITVSDPSVSNIFFESPFSLSGSSVEISAGQTDSLFWVTFTSTGLPAPPSTYTIKNNGQPVKFSAYKFSDSSLLDIKARVPVPSDGIPYIYNSQTQEYEKAYVLSDLFFEIDSDGIYFFVEKNSFFSSKPTVIYAYPVPADGDKITFANLSGNSEIAIYTISGKQIFEEKVTPDPVRKEWEFNCSKIAPGLYFWVIDGKEKGIILIRK